jgi:hypothetical protein
VHWCAKCVRPVLGAFSSRRGKLKMKSTRQRCQRSRTFPARLATSPAAMRARSSDEAENVSGHLGPVSRNCRPSCGEVTELIINAAITLRAIVETTLADKYCPRLRKEERAVLRALSFLGGGSLKQSESFQAFRRRRRADRLSREWAEIHVPRVHGRWIVAVVSAGVGEQQKRQCSESVSTGSPAAHSGSPCSQQLRAKPKCST